LIFDCHLKANLREIDIRSACVQSKIEESAIDNV